MIHFFITVLLIVSLWGSGQISTSTKDTINSQTTDRQVSSCIDDYIPLEPSDVQLPSPKPLPPFPPDTEPSPKPLPPFPPDTELDE